MTDLKRLPTNFSILRRARLSALSPAIVSAVASVGWLTFGHLSVVAIGLFVGLFVARYLGPEKYGRLNLAMSLMLIGSMIATLGMDRVVIPSFVRRRDEAGRVLGAAIVLRSIAAILAMSGIIILGAILFVGDGEMQWLTLLAAFALLPQVSQVLDTWFQSHMRPRPGVAARITAAAAGAAIRLGAIYLVAPLWVFAAIVPVMALIEAGVIVMAYARATERVRSLSAPREELWLMLRQSLPVLVSLVSYSLMLRVDQLFIGAWIDDAAVGIYAAATLLAEMSYFVPDIVLRSVLPGLAHLRDMNLPLYHRRLQQLYDLSTWFSAAVAAGVALLASPLVVLLFGREFSAAAEPLMALSLSIVFATQGIVVGAWIFVQGRQLQQSVGYVGGALLNVALNAWWVPGFGVMGAAWATVIASAVAVYLPLVIFPSMRPALWQLLNSFFAPARLAGAWFRSRG